VSSKPIRVLVVDDSAFARKVIREVLSKDPEIEVVGIARDGLEALEKISELKPDVITLDLIMPDLDGLGLLRALPKEGAPKVVIVSVSNSEADIAIEALELGAVDLVSKPTPLPTDRLYELSSELTRKVKIAAASRPQVAFVQDKSDEIKIPRSKEAAIRLVVVGTSTGGPQALTHLFKSLPQDLPTVFAIALHIPAGYTAPLAARISALGGVKIVEAVDGVELKRGEAVIAPGGQHLTIRSAGDKLFAVVSREPFVTAHHPSVDVLFQSAAEQVGSGVLGVVLTGMGDDGTRGSVKIHQAGGLILAESEASCIVYGMPRSVVEAGVVTGETVLQKMPELIVKTIFNQK
jgi:two-component system chemotaxis response regulator CheB